MNRSYLPPGGADERALVHSFGVGHGDCTLLEYVEPHGITFRMLVDGGGSLPAALTQHLISHPRPTHSPQIDVVVLTHVDYDHLGGLNELLEKNISIGEYWGPCLPAFRRLRGIFKLERVQLALDSAEILEKRLKKAGVRIIYPLEGYIQRFCNNKVVISMISPSARLIGRLLTASVDDLIEFLSQTPFPLEWLFGPGADNRENRQPFSPTASMTTPSEIANFRSAPLRLDSEKFERQVRDAMGDAFEPEFFGNGVLNDTSLVMTVDFHIARMHRRRVLLTGDQENWSYIAYKHPHGLGADLLKAPHHGGRVYLADKGADAVDQLYLWLRSPTVITSASGVYNLPRLSFRNAVRLSGGNLICPNTRTFEPLSSGAAADKDAVSCHAAYACTKGKKLQREKITVTLTATTQSADTAACVQGTTHTGLAPIRVLEQRIIEPDQSFLRWTHTEIEKYARWLKDNLSSCRDEIKTHISSGGSRYLDALHIQPVLWRALSEKAINEGHYNLAANPQAVITYAVSNGMVWSDAGSHFDKRNAKLFICPSVTEIEQIKTWISSYEYIVLPLNSDPVKIMRGGRKFDVLDCCSWGEFSRMLGAKFFYPSSVVEDSILPVVRQMFTKVYFAAVYRKVSDHGSTKAHDRWLVITKAQANTLSDDVKSDFLSSLPTFSYLANDGMRRLLEGDIKMLASPLRVESNGDISSVVDGRFSTALGSSRNNERLPDEWLLRGLW
jgi:hypothetical protein